MNSRYVDPHGALVIPPYHWWFYMTCCRFYAGDWLFVECVN